jgi:tryptophan halogenase
VGQKIAGIASGLPSHDAFIAATCKADPLAS